MTTTGFVPSYVLDSGIGKKIAHLKGLDEGWHYPTFLLYYVRNPGPLLLFDEILIDQDAAQKAIEYVCGTESAQDYESQVIKAARPTSSEKQNFEDLLQSNIFKKVNVSEMINEVDFERIAKGYCIDMGVSPGATGEYRREFGKALDFMKQRYGDNYALPDPERFEAMNLNVTQILLEKLSARPLDDIFRIPLYEVKSVATISLATLETRTAYDTIDQARQILYLPTEPIQDIDTFLTLHKDPRIQRFRNKVCELSQTRATPRQISKEILNAELELRKLDIDSFNIVIGFFGLVAGLTVLLVGNFASGTISAASGLLSIGKELTKVSKAERYDWLEVVKGLCEI
jgi:hypothetical protein